MTKLNVQGQTINVDDSFLKLSPEDQDATVQDIARQMGIHPAAAAPTPSGQDVSAISAAEGLPIIGAYAPAAAAWLRSKVRGGDVAQHKAQIEADIADYQRQHPVANAVGQAVIGSLPFAAAGGAIPGAARVLGMTGPLRTALPLAGASGAAIGAADAAARGENVGEGALTGGLTGVGGAAIGKGAGLVWDAARGMFREPVQTNFINVNGRRVPVNAPVISRDPVEAARVQDMLGSGVKTATDAEAETKAAMQAAHQDVVDRLDPAGASANVPPSAVGQSAVDELVQQEQARAAAEVARMSGVRQDTAQLATDVGGGAPGPTATADVGQTVGQRIRDLFTGARQNTRTAYDAAAAVPATYNPRYLLGAGDEIRQVLNATPNEVKISPTVTPQAQAALDTIDQEIAGLRFTNDVARGARPITPADMDQVRKGLVIQRRIANQAARSTGNWEDARAVGRVISAFDDWEQATARRAGGLLTGNPADVIATRQAARAAHATERATFSRRGPGDQVGTFMENVIGKYPGQEMSPEKIVRTLMGTPDNPAANENAVPILNHLRDNVFGANSPEWAAIKRGVISHLTEAPAGAEPIPFAKQAQRVDRFLGNQRHAGAIYDAGEQARLQQHADNLRGAEDIMPEKGTPEHMIAQLSGRGPFTEASGEELMSKLMGKNGARLATELRNQLAGSPDTLAQLKVAIWRRASEAGAEMIPWEAQKSSQKIAAFLNTPLASALYSPNELAMMRAVQNAHQQLIPIKRTVNTSGTFYRLSKALGDMKKQTFQVMGGIHGGLPGYLAGKVLDYGAGKIGERINAAEATRLFRGAQPRVTPSIAPQAALTALGQLPALRYQSQ